jgi:hypothetical protein
MLGVVLPPIWSALTSRSKKLGLSGNIRSQISDVRCQKEALKAIDGSGAEQRTKNKERRTKNEEQRTKNKEQRTKT